jgi:hypothetical protein
MDDHFFMVWNPLNYPPTFRHPTESAAREEAKRLAGVHPGKEFFVLQAIGCARKVDVEYREISDTPF